MEQSEQNTDEKRKFYRYADKVLSQIKVEMIPCPPLFGEAMIGDLSDISAGGMGILIPELIPKKMSVRMTLVLPDLYRVETIFTVRRVVSQPSGIFLHGFEFKEPNPELISHVEALMKDIVACDDRTRRKVRDVCLETCQLRQVCKRPQCVVKNIRPALVDLTNELKSLPPAPIRAEIHEEKQIHEVEDWTGFRQRLYDRLNRVS